MLRALVGGTTERHADLALKNSVRGERGNDSVRRFVVSVRRFVVSVSYFVGVHSTSAHVCAARMHTCAQGECTRVRRTCAHQRLPRKNDKSLEKTIATAGKNENLLPWRKAFDQGDR